MGWTVASSYEISYDLRKPGRNYEQLYTEIKRIALDWAHPLDSVWVVRTDLNATQIRDRLKAKMDSNDGLLVVRASSEGAWFGLPDDVSQWLLGKL